MSGVFIHSTTPRKARLLLKEKKAVIESINPFTIRLLFSESECGMKDSKSLNKNTSGLLLPEKDNTMCNKVLLYKEMYGDFYDFVQRSVDQILANPNHMKATWCRGINHACDGGIPESFAYFLFCDASVKIAKQNGIVPGNFMITGKQGFDILKSLGEPRFKLDEEHKFGVLDGTMKVYYIKSMNENKFIMSIHQDKEEYEGRDFYEKHYGGYKETNQFVVGEIVDGESPNENIEAKSGINDKCEIVSTNSIKRDSKTHLKRDSKTHLIYGAYGCGKTSMVMEIINDRIENDNNTMLFTTSCTKRLFYKNTKSPMIRIVDETCINVTADNNTPELFSKYLVQYYISREGRSYADTLIVDDYPFSTINADYSEEEYFRELTKVCKENKINLIYTKGTSSKDGIYSSLPPIFERFSDIITVLK